MRVGWLGVGAMGAPMAARAARSRHSVRAYDITPERAAALAADGVQPAETIAGAAAGADVVAIMVATPASRPGPSATEAAPPHRRMATGAAPASLPDFAYSSRYTESTCRWEGR